MKGICRKRKLKGQLVFEFMIAVVMFFGIVLYVLNYLHGNVCTYSEDFASESMESKANQIGELLVLNKGSWSGQEPVVVGLAKEWPVLNHSKILWMNASCNSKYYEFMDKLDVPYTNRLKVTVRDESGAYLVDCEWGIPMQTSMAKGEAKRYALDETGRVLTISVYVWRTGSQKCPF